MRKTALIIIISFFILSCVDKDKNAENKIVLSKNSDTTAVYKWTTELCENTGSYNPKKYSAVQNLNLHLDCFC